MSAARRGIRPRRRHDDYPTPSWCVDRLVEGCPDLVSKIRRDGDILEPAAGAGGIIETLKKHPPVRTRWWAVEKQKKYRPLISMLIPEQRIYTEDYLRWSPPRVIGALDNMPPMRFDAVVTNCPYGLALPYVQKACSEASLVVMLLRLGFLASNARAPWMRDHVPDVLVLPDRPKFTWGGSDNSDYGWMVWHGNTIRRQGVVKVLNSTPLAERMLER